MRPPRPLAHQPPQLPTLLLLVAALARAAWAVVVLLPGTQRLLYID
jgi:hypothetical protein